MPKLRIEETAARRQARIDRGEETIVGVNKYVPDDPEQDRRARRRQHGRANRQVARLKQVRESRDEAACAPRSTP